MTTTTKTETETFTASLTDADTGEILCREDSEVSEEEFAAAVDASLASDDPTGRVHLAGRTVYAD